jgi:hypothetical protein
MVETAQFVDFRTNVTNPISLRIMDCNRMWPADMISLRFDDQGLLLNG